MPNVKGVIDVNVKGLDGQSLTEYGQTRIRGPTYSSYIMSSDNAPFEIHFQPRQSPYSSLVNDYRVVKDDFHWDLVAHIYMDKSVEPEKDLIVELPQTDRPPSLHVARGRAIIGDDGFPMEQGWVFNQVAVEDRMAGLNIGSTDEQVLGGGYEAKEDDDYRTELGQIKIVFHRIKQYGVEENPKLKDYSGSREAIAKLDDNISHLVGFGEIKPYNHVQVDVDYLEMKPWATVVFWYRSKRELEKAGFLALEKPVNNRVLNFLGLNRNLGKRSYTNAAFTEPIGAKGLPSSVSKLASTTAQAKRKRRGEKDTDENDMVFENPFPKLEKKGETSSKAGSSARSRNLGRGTIDDNATPADSFSSTDSNHTKNLARKGVKVPPKRKSTNFQDDDDEYIDDEYIDDSEHNSDDEYIDDSEHNSDMIYGRAYSTRSKTKNSRDSNDKRA